MPFAVAHGGRIRAAAVEGSGPRPPRGSAGPPRAERRAASAGLSEIRREPSATSAGAAVRAVSRPRRSAVSRALLRAALDRRLRRATPRPAHRPSSPRSAR